MSGVFANEAVRYYASGVNVLPIITGTKAPPRGVLWRQWQHRRQTSDELTQLLDAHPNTDVAIILGGPGRLVDIETDGPEGERALQESGLPLPPTPMFKSPRGLHRLYRSSRPLQTRKDPWRQVEIRATKSYSVAPSSIGREWLTNERIPDVAPFHEAWEERLLADVNRFPSLVLVEIEHTGIDEGLRNLTLAQLVGRWLTQGVAEAETKHRAREWARRCPAKTHLFPPEEAERVVDSVLRTRRRTRSLERRAWLLAGDLDLDPSATSVLMGVVSLKGELGLPGPELVASHRLLARYGRVSKNTVGPALHRLHEAGLVQLSATHDPRGWPVTVVRLRDKLVDDEC